MRLACESRKRENRNITPSYRSRIPDLVCDGLLRLDSGNLDFLAV